jgi:hypothetical protein
VVLFCALLKFAAFHQRKPSTSHRIRIQQPPERRSPKLLCGYISPNN